MRKMKNPDCVHDLEKENSTIKILQNFRIMAVPDVRYGICLCCGQKFKFTIDHQNLNLEKGGALKDANVGGNKGQT